MPNPGPATTVTSNFVMVPQNQLRLLAVAKGVNVNATGDQATLQIITANPFSVFQVVMTNASISLTTALAGVFTAPAAGGTAIVANAALATLTGPTIVFQRTIASTAVQSNVLNLYLNVGTAQGAAATIDVYVYGYDLSP